MESDTVMPILQKRSLISGETNLLHKVRRIGTKNQTFLCNLQLHTLETQRQQLYQVPEIENTSCNIYILFTWIRCFISQSILICLES